MLSAMGLACIINSRRCGRTHCRFTGPFLIVMAILVIGHTIGRLPLGRFGWPILGATTFAGFVALWSGRKRAWGMFRSEEHTSELQSLMRSSYAVVCLKKTKRFDRIIIR